MCNMQKLKASCDRETSFLPLRFPWLIFGLRDLADVMVQEWRDIGHLGFQTR